MLDRPTPARSIAAALMGAVALASLFALPVAFALHAGFEPEAAGFLGLVLLFLTADMALWAVGKTVDKVGDRMGQSARSMAAQAKVKAHTVSDDSPAP